MKIRIRNRIMFNAIRTLIETQVDIVFVFQDTCIKMEIVC